MPRIMPIRPGEKTVINYSDINKRETMNMFRYVWSFFGKVEEEIKEEGKGDQGKGEENGEQTDQTKDIIVMELRIRNSGDSETSEISDLQFDDHKTLNQNNYKKKIKAKTNRRFKKLKKVPTVRNKEKQS